MIAVRSRGRGWAIVAGAGAVVVGLASLPVSVDDTSGAERWVFRAINGAPDLPYPIVWSVMQLGNVGVTAAALILALYHRRPRLGLALGAAGMGVWVVAKLLKGVVERGRPATVLDDAVLRHAESGGLGWVSGHAAVAAALLVVGWPFLSRRVRVILSIGVVLMTLARVYVGNHLPLDMVGGIALGSAVGAGVALAFGLHRHGDA